jgi:hypothetical protein
MNLRLILIRKSKERVKHILTSALSAFEIALKKLIYKGQLKSLRNHTPRIISFSGCGSFNVSNSRVRKKIDVTLGNVLIYPISIWAT